MGPLSRTGRFATNHPRFLSPVAGPNLSPTLVFERSVRPHVPTNPKSAVQNIPCTFGAVGQGGGGYDASWVIIPMINTVFRLNSIFISFRTCIFVFIFKLIGTTVLTYQFPSLSHALNTDSNFNIPDFFFNFSQAATQFPLTPDHKPPISPASVC